MNCGRSLLVDRNLHLELRDSGLQFVDFVDDAVCYGWPFGLPDRGHGLYRCSTRCLQPFASISVNLLVLANAKLQAARGGMQHHLGA